MNDFLAQSNKIFEEVVKETLSKNKSNKDFYNSVFFFLQEEWDSTLVHTTKLLNVTKNDTLVNFGHYFRGFSFLRKEMYSESRRELDLISPQFEFYYISMMRLGGVYIEEKQFLKAISFFEEVLSSTTEKDLYYSKSAIYNNIGLAYLHLSKYEKARPYLIESLKIEERRKDTINIVKCYGNVANLYYEQYKDNLAIPYFEKAYQLSKKVNNFQTKQDAADNMAVIEENRNNYKKALAYRKEYEQWKDSLNNQNKIYEVAQLEKQFAVKQKQQEVDLLQVENKAKEVERNGLLYSALTLLILLGVTFYFYKEKNKTHKIIVAQKETLDALNATKDKLFSIVSHDLRSSVNALKTSNSKLLSNLEANNLDALDTLLQRNSGIVNGAYNLLDNLLHWALLQTKQSYFYVEPLRLFFITEQVSHNYKPLLEDQGLTFENSVLKTAKVLADQESLKIILRNLLDNAIKFSKPNGQIKVYTTLNGDFCNLIVEDTGLGMSAATIATLLQDTPNLAKKENEDIIGTGLGVQLCKSYIQKNNGMFSIESTLGKGTKMIVALPKTT
jgi:signal transduction histidine kinase